MQDISAAFAQQVFVDGVFNADPHPGNLMVERLTLTLTLTLTLSLTLTLTLTLTRRAPSRRRTQGRKCRSGRSRHQGGALACRFGRCELCPVTIRISGFGLGDQSSGGQVNRFRFRFKKPISIFTFHIPYPAETELGRSKDWVHSPELEFARAWAVGQMAVHSYKYEHIKRISIPTSLSLTL